MRRRTTLGFAVLGLVAFAACRPVAPPPPPSVPQPVGRYCAPSVPSSAEAYQAAFDNLRRTYTEWASADGAVPVRISPGADQRTVWMFGDTYIGKVVPGTNWISPRDHLVNNSFVVQDGACFTPIMGGTPLARTDLIPDPGPNQWYWPASGTIENGKLQVVLLHVTEVPTLLGFEVVGVRVASFSLPGLKLLGAPVSVPNTPEIKVGTTLFRAIDGNFYLSGALNKGPVGAPDVPTPAQRHYVARAPYGQLTVGSAWTYWNSIGGWMPGIENATPMTFVDTPSLLDYALDGPAAPLTVTRAPPGAPYAYLGTTKLLDGLSPDISLFTAPQPEGPWTYKGTVANTVFPSRTSYSVATHLGLPGTTGPIIGFSTNDNPFTAPDLPPNIVDYGPHFVAPLPGLLP